MEGSNPVYLSCNSSKILNLHPHSRYYKATFHPQHHRDVKHLNWPPMRLLPGDCNTSLLHLFLLSFALEGSADRARRITGTTETVRITDASAALHTNK